MSIVKTEAVTRKLTGKNRSQSLWTFSGCSNKSPLKIDKKQHRYIYVKESGDKNRDFGEINLPHSLISRFKRAQQLLFRELLSSLY